MHLCRKQHGESGEHTFDSSYDISDGKDNKSVVADTCEDLRQNGRTYISNKVFSSCFSTQADGRKQEAGRRTIPLVGLEKESL